MEQAREAAQAVSEFFQGNPFSTPVGQQIEQATDTSLASENWALNLEICDMINHMEEGPRDAIRAIRKRLQTNIGKNNQTVMYTLTVLETCVKNCDHRLHQLVAQKEFVQELVKIIGPKFDPPQVVQEKVLSLIQSWSHAFRDKPDLKGVCEVYDDLKTKGVEFPVLDLSAAPIFVASDVDPRTQPGLGPAGRFQASVTAPVNLNAEQLAKLRSELDIVSNNLKVLRELLSELAPGQEDADDLQLLQELYTTCQKMQLRILELLEQVSNEEVTSELLLMNDELNNVFAKYDRYMANRRKEQEQRAQGKQAGTDTGAGALIDIGAPSGQVEGDLSKQISGMGVGGPAGTASNTQQPAAVKENEYNEMEGWLKQSGDREAGESGKDFDQFLSQRAAAASTLPPTTTSGQTQQQ